MPRKGFLAPLWISACLLGWTAGPALAGTVDYSGTFAYDDDLALIPVTVGAGQGVAINTTSFAAGGFAPLLSLFDRLGILLAVGSTDGCTVPDPSLQFCWDTSIRAPELAAGVYTVALTEDNNTAVGPTLADGFQWGTGQSNNFTGPQFLGDSGSFIIFGGYQRTSAWALQVAITDSVPEPSATVPLCALLLAMAVGRLRRSRAAGETQ